MKKTVSIIGGGSCALILGCELDTKKYSVTIYEKNAALARKFLVAGDGGLNLTHSEDPTTFIQRYTPFKFLEKSFLHFTNLDFIDWINSIGIKTFTGTSGRIFPEKGIKPAQVLKSVTKKISENNVGVLYGYEWKGFSGSKLIFDSSEERKEIESDIVIFCLGGASWPVTGSKGDWLIHFKSRNISVKPFLASNCVFLVDWPADFIKKAEGKVLKNIQITCNGKTHAGEVVVTKSGIEGSGIYPLSPQIRNQLMNGNAQILIDLKPQIELKTISAKIIAIIGQKNFSDKLKSELNLDSVTLQLLKCVTSKSDFLNPDTLAKNIKALPLMIKGTGPIEDAISTTGGISLEEIDDFQLKKMPQHYVIGEMLDYDAPTGGYLLQSCFSMSKYLADKLNTL